MISNGHFHAKIIIVILAKIFSKSKRKWQQICNSTFVNFCLLWRTSTLFAMSANRFSHMLSSTWTSSSMPDASSDQGWKFAAILRLELDSSSSKFKISGSSSTRARPISKFSGSSSTRARPNSKFSGSSSTRARAKSKISGSSSTRARANNYIFWLVSVSCLARFWAETSQFNSRDA